MPLLQFKLVEVSLSKQA